GLGLSIVKHVAASHDGEVRVWSAPGQGSSFTLTLPRRIAAPDTEVRRAGAPSEDTAGEPSYTPPNPPSQQEARP
ncbi:MAG TPA: ATP-binding protein, partial [Nocardioidaceae bacterium]|nr:ATP-binding protein [Nocardioidaceae bacterium]